VGKPAGWFDDYDVVMCANYSWEPFAETALQCKSAHWVWLNVEQPHIGRWEDKERWLREIFACFDRCLLAEYARLGRLRTAGTEGDIEAGSLVRYVLVGRGHNEPFRPREYGHGLQCGRKDEGTVTLQALHLAAIMGVDEIDAYGCELSWKSDEPVHFYERERVEPPDYQDEHWRKSAEYIKTLLPVFEKSGIRVNLKCKGRLSA